MKIVFFGDSLIHGSYGVNFVEKVASVFPDHQFTNAGMNGDTSLNLFRRVQEDVIDHKPDGCFVMIGINDAVSCAEPGARPYYRLAKGVKGGKINPIFFRENMRAIFGKLLRARIKIWTALPPIEYRPEAVAALREINEIARELCVEMDIPALDIMKGLVPASIPQRPPIGLSYYRQNLMMYLGHGKPVYEKLRAEGNYTYTFDGIHLTEVGANHIADSVTAFLKSNGLV